MDKKIHHTTEEKVYEQTIERRYRNYKWIMYLFIAGLVIMFFTLTFFYFLDHLITQQADIKLLPLFYWNTLILISSNYIVYLAKRYFKQDNFLPYKTALLMTFGSGSLFIVSQLATWVFFFKLGFPMRSHSAAYIYTIFGLHAIYVVGGLFFLGKFIYKSYQSLSDYAMSIMYFTDPVVKYQLHLFSIFWYVLCIIWVYLIFFFMVFG